MEFIKTKTYIEKKIKELHLPYFAILVKKDGKAIFEYNHKVDDFNNDLLCMYSMSKPVTCAAFMQLVQKGLVKLDDNVCDYLDGYDVIKSFYSGEQYKTPIKMWHLLSMSSGLDYNLGRKAVKDLVEKCRDASTIDVCSMFAKDGILFEPGKGYQYSLSLDVIASVVEKVSGVKFSTYVKENIFDVLGMKNSTFTQNDKLAKSCRAEYWPNADITDIENKPNYYLNFFPSTSYESGGAGLISTVKDYSLFADSIACRTNKILADSLADEIGKVIVSNTPFNETVQEFSKSSVDYGYGLAVRVRKSDSIEGIPAGEFGWDGAAGSYSLMDRKNHISIVMGMTIMNWPAYIKDLHIAIVKELYKEIFSK